MHSGTVIREGRKALDLTQEQLGELAGVHHATVSRIERGLYQAPRRTIKALTDALAEAKDARDRGVA